MDNILEFSIIGMDRYTLAADLAVQSFLSQIMFVLDCVYAFSNIKLRFKLSLPLIRVYL